MMDETMLARPVWHALSTLQAGHARGGADALRFPPEIGPLAAMRGADAAGLSALAALAAPGDVLAMIEQDIAAFPEGMILERQSAAVQMIADTAPAPVDDPAIRPLGEADAPDMRALAALTEPGPFAARTHVLGRFWGVREAGRLIAMAGERTRMPGFGEVSAVCVHTDARGRGLGTLMVRKAMASLAAQGLRPFLHSYADNEAAIATYRRCGMRVARPMIITIMRKPDREA